LASATPVTANTACFLLTGDDPAGLFQQNAQLSIGVRRTNMGQDHHPAPVFARDLHRHRPNRSA